MEGRGLIGWAATLLVLASGVYAPTYFKKPVPTDTLYIEREHGKFTLNKTTFKGETVLFVNNTEFKNFSLKITAKDAPGSYEQSFWFPLPETNHIADIPYDAQKFGQFHARFIYLSQRNKQVVHGPYLLTQQEQNYD